MASKTGAIEDRTPSRARSGAMRELDWLDRSPIDQRRLFQGNSVLRGGQTPRIEAPGRSRYDLRIA
jgi:uncharacterized protein